MIYNEDPLKYIYETPTVLQYILGNIDTIIANAIQVIEKKHIEEIYLIGCGSSYNAAKIAEKYYQDLLDIRVRSLSPEEFMRIVKVVSSKALVIGISQQGTSVGVISALDMARELKVTTVAVTGEYHTEITLHADMVVYVECGYEDAGATTKGFTATAFTLMLMCRRIWEIKNNIGEIEKKKFHNFVLSVIQNMEASLEANADLCEQFADELKDSNDLVIITEGKWNPLLDEVVLKFSESCRYPVRGFEAEEFMHGYYNSVTEDTDLFFLQDDGKKIEKLYKYYNSKDYRTFCWGKKTGDIDYDEYYSVFIGILFLQKLFVLTSKKRGIELNIPKDPDFHKIMGSKLEADNDDKEY